MVNKVLRARELSKSLAEKQGQGKPRISPADHAHPHHIFRDKAVLDKGRTHLQGVWASTEEMGENRIRGQL